MTQIGERIAELFGWDGPAEPGSVAVEVVEQTSGEPVARVEVTLRGPERLFAITGADGVARFPRAPAGTYIVHTAQPEFEISRGKDIVYVAPGEANTVSLKITRILLTVVMKRIHIAARLNSQFAGHWWTEIDGEESYGWYPARRPDPIWRGLTGVPGRLNGGIGEGTPTMDAHHGETAADTFHPRVLNGGSAVAIKRCIRDFAHGHGGTWSYPTGQNCHSFQEGMMEHCGMVRSGKGPEQ